VKILADDIKETLFLSLWVNDHGNQGGVAKEGPESLPCPPPPPPIEMLLQVFMLNFS